MTTEAPEPKWSDFAKYLTGPHLDGKAIVVTISAVVGEEIYSKQLKQKRICPVVYFEGKKIGLPLSDVNQIALCRMFGNNMKNVVGKRVKLKAIPMRVGGEDKLPIRIFDAPQESREIDNQTNSAKSVEDVAK